MSVQVEEKIRCNPEAFVETESPARSAVLIVDDTKYLRNLLKMYLSAQGFDAYVAANGKEALQVYRKHANRIGAVLMDVQMPHMSGPSALSALQKINPDVHCCFMSGDPGRFTETDLLEMGARHFFPKPLPLGEVVDALRELTTSP